MIGLYCYVWYRCPLIVLTAWFTPFAAFGVLEMLGRPLVMLYPIYLVTQSALHVSTEIKTNKSVFR